MKEDFLHYLWQHQKLMVYYLQTIKGDNIYIFDPGTPNQNSGPDFFNARIKIGDQIWTGNVEIHVKSSDWFVHHHENDSSYDNVILHVVWEHDVPVFRKDNTELTTLEIKDKVPPYTLENYYKLFNTDQQWINCDKDFPEVDSFKLNNWLERLFIERLERKSLALQKMLQRSNNNWEAVLFKLLAKNFGLKINAEAFLSVANSFDFSVVRKTRRSDIGLEALLLGQAGLLEVDIEEPYLKMLQKEYAFLKIKFKLDATSVLPIKFFRLRPSSFPTIRLSQLGHLYHQQPQLFNKLIKADRLNDIYQILGSKTSTFWETHYTFNKTSKRTTKKLSKSFINLLIINTLIPLKFCYAAHRGNDVNDNIIDLVSQLPPEQNTIITKFNTLKKVSHTALHSQALLQLRNEYCVKNQCLKCVVGNAIIASQNF